MAQNTGGIMDKHDVICDECGDISIEREEHWAETTGQYEPLFCPFCGNDVELDEGEEDEEYE